MQFLPNENTILSSNGNRVILTNFRICGDFKEKESAHKTLIFLEDISSVHLVFQNNFYLMGLGILCLLYGIFMQSQGDRDQFGIMSIILGVIFLAVWWGTRKKVISIYPKDGNPLQISAHLMKEEVVNDFIDKIQLAKSERIKLLYKI